MIGYAFHPQAEADIDEIWEYIAADNPAAADRVTADIEKLSITLCCSPVRAIDARISLHSPCASFRYANT